MNIGTVGEKQQNTMTKKMRNVGMGVGATYAGACILMQGKDIYKSTVAKSIKDFGTKKYGILATGIAAAIYTGIYSAIGALAGMVTGKIAEKVAEKNEQKKIIEEVNNMLDSQKVITLSSETPDMELLKEEARKNIQSRQNTENNDSNTQKNNLKNIDPKTKMLILAGFSALAADTAVDTLAMIKNHKIPVMKDEDVSAKSIEERMKKQLAQLDKKIAKYNKTLSQDELQEMIRHKLGNLSFPQSDSLDY